MVINVGPLFVCLSIGRMELLEHKYPLVTHIIRAHVHHNRECQVLCMLEINLFVRALCHRVSVCVAVLGLIKPGPLQFSSYMSRP